MSTLSVNNVTEVGGAPVVTAGVLDSGSLPTGTVLQVVSTTKSDSFTSTTTSFADITGLSASITPSSASNKVLVTVTVNGASANADSLSRNIIRLARGGTGIAVGDSASSRTQASITLSTRATGSDALTPSGSINFLDSPASTSSITYSVQCLSPSGGTLYINRTQADDDNASNPRLVSTITLMEVAG